MLTAILLTVAVLSLSSLGLAAQRARQPQKVRIRARRMR
jgi:hypothetical protein